MNIRICTPVVGNTLETFLSNLEKTQEVSDFVELRVDYIQGFSVDMIAEVRSRVTKKSIFTCRKKEEGGSFEGSEDMRREILQTAIGLFDHVDIELSTLQSQLFDRDQKTKIIVSYHNFISTPSFWDLQKIVYDMNQLKPDILKIATMLTKEYETTKIYRLLTNKSHTEERIVIGMGEYGRITRVLAPLMGGYLTFASTEYGESAPGQIDIMKLRQIYQKLV